MMDFAIQRRSAACNTCKAKCEGFKKYGIAYTTSLENSCPIDRWAPLIGPGPRPLPPEPSPAEKVQRVRDLIASIEKQPKRLDLAKPGDLLAFAIFHVTGEEASNCSCDSRREEMNRNGWIWCIRNREKIQGWLIQSARQRGIALDTETARDIFRIAWRALKNKDPEK